MNPAVIFFIAVMIAIGYFNDWSDTQWFIAYGCIFFGLFLLSIYEKVEKIEQRVANITEDSKKIKKNKFLAFKVMDDD